MSAAMHSIALPDLPGEAGLIVPLGAAPFAGLTGEKRTLIYVPRAFDRRRPFRIVAFFHGDRGVVDGNMCGIADADYRYRLPHQIAALGGQTILIAPQRPEAANRAGAFARGGAFAAFIAEAQAVLARYLELPPGVLAEAPLLLAAFSGGRVPCRAALQVGGVTPRIRGVVLIDTFFSTADATGFAAIAARHPGWMFALLYGPRTAAHSRRAFDRLEPASRRWTETEAAFGDGALPQGAALCVATTAPHARIVAEALGGYPLARILRRMLPLAEAPPVA